MNCLEDLMKNYFLFQVQIKQEKLSDTEETFIPRPIKQEPVSDVEGMSKTKKRTSSGTNIRSKKIKSERDSSSSESSSKDSDSDSESEDDFNEGLIKGLFPNVRFLLFSFSLLSSFRFHEMKFL